MKKFKIIKPRSLFKNDFFGIKRKIYERKMINNLIARNHVKADKLSDILDIVTYISILYDEGQKDKLKYICEKYDSLIEDINDTMNQVKKMIE